MPASAPPRLLERRRFSVIALIAVAVLVAAGLAIGLFSEQAYRSQAAREAGLQADLIASSVTGPLAFGDTAEVQRTIDAVRLNPRVLAAAVYDDQRRLVASFARQGETVNQIGVDRPEQTTFRGDRLYVVRNVSEAGLELGTVRLRLQIEPMGSRASRYAGLVLMLAVALVAVALLGVAQAALGRANTELKTQARDLADSNRRLQDEMAERAKAEAALRQSQKMEAIGRLTGGVAHDFNNLLMVASSGIDLMDRTEDPERREKLKAGVKQAVARGAALTKQLLAFSRSSALKAEVVDLKARVEAMQVILDRSLREDIQVSLRLPDGLWPVEVDPNELELAILNIAVNARDAMPAGGLIEITATNVEGMAAGRDHVCLAIRDTGSGMSEETLAKVFEPFFTTKPVGQGTGLGLSQVYGFARSSGGEVLIDSREGEGTVISLCLPPTDKAARAPDLHSEGPCSAGNGGRALLVEDDDGVAAMVEEMLVELGFEVTRSVDGQDGLRRLEADPGFDLVLSDMVMPGELDGRMLAREIRARLPGMPVLLTSGFSAAAAAAEADGFRVLAKPYRIEALSEAIAEACEAVGHAEPAG